MSSSAGEETLGSGRGSGREHLEELFLESACDGRAAPRHKMRVGFPPAEPLQNEWAVMRGRLQRRAGRLVLVVASGVLQEGTLQKHQHFSVFDPKCACLPLI